MRDFIAFFNPIGFLIGTLVAAANTLFYLPSELGWYCLLGTVIFGSITWVSFYLHDKLGIRLELPGQH